MHFQVMLLHSRHSLISHYNRFKERNFYCREYYLFNNSNSNSIIKFMRIYKQDLNIENPQSIKKCFVVGALFIFLVETRFVFTFNKYLAFALIRTYDLRVFGQTFPFNKFSISFNFNGLWFTFFLVCKCLYVIEQVKEINLKYWL